MLHKDLMGKLDFIKIENFCSMKNNVKTMRRQATDWEKIFAKDTSDKGLLSKIHKEALKLIKKNNNPNKKWVNNLNTYLPKEDIRMANQDMKGCSPSDVLGEVQIKTITRHYCITIRPKSRTPTGQEGIQVP